ncbi:motility associated factor glycosyltransferase family protein [Candidatus Dependentiae bacterium]|nr:motility associated factor glycosyltransferase family protein [Candidatus Dependentiae bacterium]
MIFNKELLDYNFDLIKKKNYQLASSILSHLNQNKYKINLEKTKSGVWTYSEYYENNQIHVHSKYDPEKEAERLVPQYNITDNDFAVFIKPGLGYHIKKILDSVNPYFLIIEPDFNILISMLQTIKLPQSLDKWNIAATESEQEIKSYFSSMFNPVFVSKINYIILQSIISIFREKINFIKNYLSEAVDNIIAQAVTLSYFGDIYHSNVINNFNQFAASPGIINIKNKFSKAPAIIVSAGPSLDYNIGELYKHRKKFIIIAVDTVYKKLIDYDIIPHFTITIDPQNKSYFHFKDINLHNYFITCLICSNKVVKHLENKSLFFVSDYPLSMYFESVTTHKGQLSTAGGSVSTIAFQFAEYIGADPIFFIGQDLSYPVMKTHCNTTMYEECGTLVLSKFNTMENMFAGAAENKIFIKGIKTVSVPTTRQLLEYYRWYCSQVKISKRKIINCTYDGAFIEGIEHCDLKEAIEKYKITNTNLDLSLIQEIINSYSKKKYPDVFPEIISRLSILKKSIQAHRFHIKNLDDLRNLLSQNSGLFELIKTISYSKSLVSVRKRSEASEIEKVNIIINILLESIDYTINLANYQISAENQFQ